MSASCQKLVARAAVLTRRERLDTAAFELPSVRRGTTPDPEGAERQQIEEAPGAARGRLAQPMTVTRFGHVPADRISVAECQATAILQCPFGREFATAAS
jgi:hypothetical protein